MEVSRSNWRENAFRVTLESPAEAFDFSHGVSFIRRAFINYRASIGKNVNVEMGHDKLLRVATFFSTSHVSLVNEGKLSDNTITAIGVLGNQIMSSVESIDAFDEAIALQEEQFHQALL